MSHPYIISHEKVIGVVDELEKEAPVIPFREEEKETVSPTVPLSSREIPADWGYISGFFDADGAIAIKPRKYVYGIRATISQKTLIPLVNIKEFLSKEEIARLVGISRTSVRRILGFL